MALNQTKVYQTDCIYYILKFISCLGAFLTLGSDLQPEIQQFYAHNVQQTDFGVTIKAGVSKTVPVLVYYTTI